jgi:hypothetical protein
MSDKEKTKRGRAIHYFPIIAVMIFYLGACVASSLIVKTPHITHLGFVTLPLVAAAIAASQKIRRELNRDDR